MSEIIIENLPDEVEKTTISFGDDEEIDELSIKDAEIISETKREPVKNAVKDSEIDDFTLFLSTLPEDCNPTIIIKRQPDRNYAGQFRTSCETQENTGTLNWNNYTDASQIYDDIAKQFGGGRYTIQIKDGQRFEKNRTWTDSIGDPVGLSEKEKTSLNLKTKADEQPRNIESSQVFANPQPEPEKKNFLREAMEEMKALKEFQDFISPPRPDVTTATGSEPQPITKETIKMALIEKALNNPDLVEKAIEAVFDIPPDSPDAQQGTLIEVIKFAASHQTETKALLDIALSSVGTLFSSLLPKPPPTIPPGIIQNGLQRFKRESHPPAEAQTPENVSAATQPPETAESFPLMNQEISAFPFIALEG